MATVDEMIDRRLPQDNLGESERGHTLLRILLPLGLLLAIAGQVILSRTPFDSPALGNLLALGGALLFFGAAAFGIATVRSIRLDAWPAGAQGDWPRPSAGAFSPWLPALMVSLAAAVAAIAIFALAGEISGVVALWLGGMLLFTVAQLRGTGLGRNLIAKEELPYIAGLGALLVITVFTRTWHLTTLPLNLDGDFASVGLQARDLATGQQKQIFAFGWAAIPMLGYLPTWASMLLFGTGLAGLNAAGVMQGTLIVLGTYLIGCELFNARVALLAAALLVISYAHLAISRQAVYVDPVFSATFAVYFLIHGMRKGKGWAVALSGFLTAFSTEVYYSGRALLPVLAFALLYMLVFHRAWLFARWKGLVIFVLAVLVAVGPMSVLFLRSPDATLSRSREVIVTNPDVIKHLEGVYGVNSFRGIMVQQAIRTALLFNYYIDKGTQFALLQPFLDPFSGVLFVLGFGYVLFHLHRPGSWLILWWILLGLVFGSLLTANPPFWPRLVILLPPVALACALALEAIYVAVRSWTPLGAFARIAFPVLVALALLIVGIRNWNVYVQVKGNFATGRTRIADYVLHQPAATRAYLVSGEYNYQDREFSFLIPGRLIKNLTPEQALDNLVPVGSPTLLIVSPDLADVAQALSARYPGAPLPGNSPGEIAFYAFQLP
jgi:dolichyl-phosphate-mannose-protein mannosyltransferase